MAMRLTGLMSGMDTESIIQQLVAAKQTKVDDTKKAQTKLSWKQDAWKSLNTKLKNLQNQISSMRFTSAYVKKKTTVSNSSVASVITGEGAVYGTQELEVNKVAKTGYLTGAQISEDGKYTAMSKMSDLAGDSFNGGKFTVKTGTTSVDIEVTKDTTISDVLNQFKSAGLNASFDAKWQRFNISSTKSGTAADFSITAADAGGNAALAALGLQTDIGTDKATAKEYMRYASYVVKVNDTTIDDTATLNKLKPLIDASVQVRTDSYLEQYKNVVAAKEEAEKKKTELETQYSSNTNWQSWSVEKYDEEVKAQEERIKQLTADGKDADTVRAAEEKLVTLKKEASDRASYDAQLKNIKDADDTIADIKKYVDITETSTTDADGKTVKSYSAAETADLRTEEKQNHLNKAKYAEQALRNYEQNADGTYKTDANGDLVLKAGEQATGNATKVSGQDAEIKLNGATYTNSTNAFEINGLTITALAETNGSSVTITTDQDTDGIYDMVKNFIKTYNEIINEMDKLYNAESSKGYEPLTNDEKEAMSEADIKEWETKIKDSLLRKDETVSSISSGLRSVMSGGISVNGKNMYLWDFGIETISYLEAADNEKHAYHIFGDPDDANTSGKDDMLKSMIANDPDTVVSFFTQLSRSLYSKMSDLSSGVDGYRTYGSFYNDKKMKSDYNNYTTKIADLEDKLAAYEDKWYAKFAAMETAMAKMQKNMSSISSLLGG